jgi:hypothetical protein
MNLAHFSPFLETAVVRAAFSPFQFFGLVSAPILSGFNFKLNKMSESKKQENVYEFLNSKQQKIASKIEALVIGLTVSEAKDLLYCVRKAVEKTKIS